MKPRLSIQKKLMVLLLLVSLVPTFIVAYFAYLNGRSSLKESIGSNFEKMSIQTIDNIDRLLHSARESTKALATNELMQDVIADDPDGMITKSLVRIKNEFKIYYGVYCFNTKGHVVASSEVNEIGMDFSSAPWLNKIRVSRNSGILETQNNDLTSQNYDLVLYTPIIGSYDESNQIIGYLVSILKWDELNKITRSIHQSDSESFSGISIYLLDHNDALIFKSSENNDNAEIIDDQFTRKIPELIISNDKNSGYVIASLFKNSDSLISFAKSIGYHDFSGLDWRIFFVKDLNAAFAPLESLRVKFLLFCLIIIIVVCLISYYYSSNISNPIRKITNVANAIASGDFSSQIKIDTNDEIMDLAESINQMNKDLKESRIQIEYSLTKAKNALEDSEKMRIVAEDAVIAKTAFLANMSHEIRTPMNAIIGLTELLLDTKIDDHQTEYLTTVRNAGDSLLFIINDILDLSKIESGKLDIEEIVFDIHELVLKSVEIIVPFAQQKKIEVTVFYDPEINHTLKGDPDRINQVIVNLCNNAIKFTEIGNVDIRVDLVNETKDDMSIKVSVSDSGIGIRQERLQAIFDNFTQADSSTTRRFGGTGLGLSISKKLIELMNGKIHVESKVNIGSVFWFELTLPKVNSIISDQDLNKINDCLKNLKVIVVDDNITNLLIVRKTLEAYDCSVTETLSPHKCLVLMKDAVDRAEAFDIAILDYQMPDMDGLEVFDIIKKNETLSQTPVIVLTSITNLNIRNAFRETGVLNYLTKPVRTKNLISMIYNMMTDSETKIETIDSSLQLRDIEDSGDRLKILLVEDNIVNQKVAVKFLEKVNHVVDVAANGRIAVERAKFKDFDIILMDIQMPVMDGYEATRVIRDVENMSSNVNTPIIAMTAHAMKGDREKCLDAGMNDYITKPIKSEILYKILTKWSIN